MDTVSRVALVADEGVFMGSLDDRAGFHNLSLQPESWPLFGVHYDGVDVVCATLPFGWNESPFCYHSLSEAKAAYMCSNGIPVLAYIDDAWYANFVATFGESDRVQWLSAAEAFIKESSYRIDVDISCPSRNVILTRPNSSDICG